MCAKLGELPYSFAEATFEIGYIGCSDKEVLGLGLGADASGSALNERDWVCLLTKRATVSAIRKYPELDPKTITLNLIDIRYKQ